MVKKNNYYIPCYSDSTNEIRKVDKDPVTILKDAWSCSLHLDPESCCNERIGTHYFNDFILWYLIPTDEIPSNRIMKNLLGPVVVTPRIENIVINVPNLTKYPLKEYCDIYEKQSIDQTSDWRIHKHVGSICKRLQLMYF